MLILEPDTYLIIELCSKLYAIANHNFDNICNAIATCVPAMIQAKDWRDNSPALPPSRRGNLDGITLFTTLITFLSQ
jgi:hypothetical protein